MGLEKSIPHVIVRPASTADIVQFFNLKWVKVPDRVIEHRPSEETHFGHGFLGIARQDSDCDYTLIAQHPVHIVHHAINIRFPRFGREFVQEAEAIHTIERTISKRELPRVRVCQSAGCTLSQFSLLCNAQTIEGSLRADNG